MKKNAKQDRKKRLRAAVLMLCILAVLGALAGCKSKQTESADTGAGDAEAAAEAAAAVPAEDAKEPVEKETENADAPAEEPRYEYPAEDRGSEKYQSPTGYSLLYDPKVFTLEETAETATFTYNTAETLDAPVYVAVQLYGDMDEETLAQGLVLQSGTDDASVQETTFGADGITVKNVYYEKENNGIKQVFAFFVIPTEKGTQLVEAGGYTGMPETISSKIEEILGTFSLQAE